MASVRMVISSSPDERKRQKKEENSMSATFYNREINIK